MSKRPTNKWWAALVTGLGALMALVVSNGWNDAATIAAIGLATQMIVAYLTPNTQPV